MKQLKTIVLISVLLFIPSIEAQKKIGGTVISASTKQTLAYVNIGIVGKGIGTVTDKKGNFKFIINKKNYRDSIKISMIGYKSKTYLIQDFIKKDSKEITIYLSEKNEILNEIVISNKKLKRRVLGNRTKSKLFTDGFESDQLGCEAGLIIKIRKSPTFIKSFHAFIASNTHDKLKFRLNFYSIKEGLPHKNILKENIIIESTLKEGLLSVDLTKYDIVMEEDFFVSLEWIENFGEGNLQFSVGLFGSPVIYRNASQANWQKISAIGPGFNVVVMY